MRGLEIVNMFGIIFAIMCLSQDVPYLHDKYTELEAAKVQQNINYAVDAGVESMLANTEDINLDYKDWGNIELNIKEGWTTFENCFVMSRTRYVSEKAIENLEQQICGAIIFAYDGYYTIQRESVYKDELSGRNADISKSVTYKTLTKQLCISPKIPYTYRFSPDDDYCYILNVGGRDMQKFNTRELIYETVSCREVFEEHGLDYTNEVKIKLATIMSDAINILLFNYYGGDNALDVLIPAGVNANDANPIDSITMIVIMNGTELTRGKVLMGIGGTKIDTADYFITYEYGGEKLYTIASKREQVESLSGVIIKSYYTSREDAAKFGFKYDLALEE